VITRYRGETTTVSVDDPQSYIDDMARARGYVLDYHQLMAKQDFPVLKATNDLVSRAYLDQRTLDRRAKELIFLVTLPMMRASKGHIQSHIQVALDLGVSAGGILEAIEIALPRPASWPSRAGSRLGVRSSEPTAWSRRCPYTRAARASEPAPKAAPAPTGPDRGDRMAFVCQVTWTVKEGDLDTVLDAIRQVAAPSRQERGVRVYQPYRDPDKPNVIRLFEVYDDEAAFKIHCDSEHFQKWVLGIAVPLLEDRAREFYETIEL
jgi:4-carboxymuconolactone decarboxylase